MAKINWDAAKAKYISDPTISYEDIAREFMVSLRSVAEKAGKDSWVKAKQENSLKIQENLIEEVNMDVVKYQAKKFRQGINVADKMTRILLDDNTKIGGKVAVEGLVAGHKIASEALGLDNPKTNVIVNNNFLTLNQFVQNIDKRIQEAVKPEDKPVS